MPAISLHVYAPALEPMTFFDDDPRDDRPVDDRRAGLPASRRLVSDGVTLAPSSRPVAGRDAIARAHRRRSAGRGPPWLAPAPGPSGRARDGRTAGLLVDIRPEAQRRAEGEPVGAIVIERNVLEWRLDPQSPNRLPIITGHDQVIVVICSEGYASSFAAAQPAPARPSPRHRRDRWVRRLARRRSPVLRPAAGRPGNPRLDDRSAGR